MSTLSTLKTIGSKDVVYEETDDLRDFVYESGLSPVKKKIIALKFFEGYHYREIAKRLKLPYHTVTAYAKSALTRLEKELETDRKNS